MESKDRLKEINIRNCTFYDFDYIMGITGIDFNNILLGEKSN